MICMVCGHEFDRDDSCPYCNYPVTLLTDDSENATKEEQERADAYRNKLFNNTKLYMMGYEYQLQQGQAALLKKNQHVIGTVLELRTRPFWLSQKITNLQDGVIPVEIAYTLWGKPKLIRCQMRANSTDPELTFGALVDKNLKLHLILKDQFHILDVKVVRFLT